MDADRTTTFAATVACTQSDCPTLALAGTVSEDALPKIALLIDPGRRDHVKVILDLGELTLFDPADARFFADQFRIGARLVNCPVYIRRWVVRKSSVEPKEDEPDE